jgi:hypothetical protein
MENIGIAGITTTNKGKMDEENRGIKDTGKMDKNVCLELTRNQ